LINWMQNFMCIRIYSSSDYWLWFMILFG
jgi:hypothetical protein